MKIENVMKVFHNFVGEDEQLNGYHVHGGMIENKDTFYMYAQHNSDSDKSVYWHCEQPRQFTDRELGLMAAASIMSMFSYKEVHKV